MVFQEAPWVVPSEEVADPRELYIAAFDLHREGHEGYAGYSSQLPNGVALDDLEGDVLRKMGSTPHSRGVAALASCWDLSPIGFAMHLEMAFYTSNWMWPVGLKW